MSIPVTASISGNVSFKYPANAFGEYFATPPKAVESLTSTL